MTGCGGAVAHPASTELRNKVVNNVLKLVKKEISLINIKKALIVIETDTINVNSNSKLNTLKCGLLIEDTELVKGFIQKDIKCRSHNPKSEMKSSRNYGNK